MSTPTPEAGGVGEGGRPDCFQCKHLGWDPDGIYCGHPIANERSIFGLSTNVMRGPCMGMPEGPCGKAGQLWEQRA